MPPMKRAATEPQQKTNQCGLEETVAALTIAQASLGETVKGEVDRVVKAINVEEIASAVAKEVKGLVSDLKTTVAAEVARELKCEITDLKAAIGKSQQSVECLKEDLQKLDKKSEVLVKNLKNLFAYLSED